MRRHAKALIAALTLLACLGAPSALADTPPSVTIDTPSAVTYNSAHVEGTVNPNGGPSTTNWYLRYAPEADAEIWQTFGSGEISGAAAEGNSPVAVDADLPGLQAGTEYFVRLYAKNEGGANQVESAVKSFTTEAVEPAVATFGEVTAVTATSAHFTGTVNSGGTGPGEATEYAFRCSPECPGIEALAPIVSDGTDQAVEADAIGLDPNTEYTVTLHARNAGGESNDVTSFTTAAGGPEVETLSIHGPIAASSARVLATVDPNNLATTYRFEYGATASYGQSTNPSAPISGPARRIVGQDIAGLAPQTTYHYRVVAYNGVGAPVVGEGHTFTTAAAVPQESCPNETIRQRQSAQMLGSCRAWELVGPFGKEQSNIFYGDIAAAGDRALLGGTTAADGGGIITPTLSVREPSGWEYRPLMSAGERLFPNYLFTLYNAELTRFIAQASNSLLGGYGPTGTIALEEGGLETVLSVLSNPGSSATNQAGNDDLTHVFGPIRTGPERIQHLFEISQDPPVQVDLLPDGSTPACGIDLNGSWAHDKEGRWVSSDGSRVFFFSYVHDDENGEPCGFPLGPKRLYMRDLDLGETTLISTPALAGPYVSDLEFLGARADGKAALFATATRFDPDDADESADVYRWSEGAGNSCLTCVAPAAAAINGGPNYALNVAASSDFSHVYFISSAALAPGAVPGERNLYAWRVTAASGPEGEVDFVAPGEGFFANQVSANGRFLAFHASSPGLDQLSGSGGSGYLQLYRYDDVSRSVVCVSCPSGHAATADLYPDQGLRRGSVANRSSTRIMSDDGSHLAFPASEALVAADVNDSVDVYAWHEGRLSLVSDGRTEASPQHEALFLGISGNGNDVLFLSDAALTPDSEADASHAYVARIAGGFPSPVSPPSPCGGEGCQAAPTGPPVSPAAATAGFVGPANLKPPRRCRPGKKHCRGKKRQHAKNHKRGHRAGANRRASR